MVAVQLRLATRGGPPALRLGRGLDHLHVEGVADPVAVGVLGRYPDGRPARGHPGQRQSGPVGVRRRPAPAVVQRGGADGQSVAVGVVEHPVQGHFWVASASRPNTSGRLWAATGAVFTVTVKDTLNKLELVWHSMAGSLDLGQGRDKMDQPAFSDLEYQSKKRKTRREQFFGAD